MPTSPDFSWFQVLAAALGGGLTVKLVDIIYQEFRRRSDNSRAATRFVDQHLDPLLKAADELVGKLVSLAGEDFKPLIGQSTDLTHVTSNDLGALLYLFGRFWARVEIIRLEGLTVAISEDSRGKQLQEFLSCLESKRVRILDRISQRAIGELLTKTSPQHLQTVGYVEFIRALEGSEETRRWLEPLALVLSKANHTSERQRLLLYGVVIHTLIDTLDRAHIVTKDRPSYPSKLSQKTKRDLRYRVFGVYLRSVSDQSKYLDSRKRGRPKKG